MRKVIDAQGLTCPLPVIETKKALKEMSQGQLEVVVDNIIALQNLEKMAKQTGLNYQTETVHARKHLILITVGEKAAEVSRPSVSTPLINNKVVVLSSEFMGEGDLVLGQVLMKGFIYALGELEELPAKVLLYNSGVKLAIHGSDSLGDLQKLTQHGVEVLSCGTCLDFYQLQGKLGVGNVTNMYEIVQSIVGATQVIKP